MTEPRSIDDLRKWVKDAGIDALDLKYCDMNGRWHHLTLPARAVHGDLFEKGVGFDGSSVSGFSRLESGDLVILPDPASAFLDPFWEAPTLSILCDVREADTRKPYSRDPRSMAKRAEAVLAESGIADRSLWGPEFEFYVFDRVSVENEPGSVSAVLLVEDPDNRLIPIPAKGGYHLLPPLDREKDLRAFISRELEACGIRVHYHHHEVGRYGQNEIEVERETLTRAADIVMMVKYFVRLGAQRFGRTATFMPKPIFGEAGSGMHFHQHLFRGETPVFHGESGYAGLSRTALQYIAGILDHGRALSALGSPSTNSYKRLVPGFEAPVNLFFSLANRSAAVRVPKYAEEPEAKRIEFRPPDATCNPYLAMASQLLAGLDGIRRELDPTACGFGPFDEDIFRWDAEQRKTIRPLPRDLGDALDALLEDHAFLLQGGVFTEEFIDVFVRTKKETELIPLSRRTHPYEVELYYDA
ncbi:MAG: type I glutamate--ammonia ligase [Planctomycetota bacterium]|jgi:glutamine synthetase